MMTTANKSTGQEEKITALYGRLSDDDGVDMESNSISNQRTILMDYCRQKGYPNPRFFYDDGVSGTTFQRPGFQEMEAMVEDGKISTIIVKDLSRFGRNYLEVGRYLEVVYPSLGVNFVAIQENVDTKEGTGTEMMPFFNIFNEWHSAQTSKKIRAVWAMKAANGKRISSTVPYGYVRDKDNHEIWRIDEPAAKVVRKIYALCLAGRGPMQIANQLQSEQIMCPTAYKLAMGRKGNHTPPIDPYVWSNDTVAKILCNRQYTGCTVNFMTTTVSYKVHKVIFKPEDEWQIIPNTQDAIIDEDTWIRVQELRKNKRRHTATGRTSMFSGLVFCPDCGAKLHFAAAKSLKPNQEHFRCSNYKSGRGKCTVHYIRNVVLEKIVFQAISELSEFVQYYEPVFLGILKERNISIQQKELRAMEHRIEQHKKRISDIDVIIEKLYEDHALGDLSAERFAKMSTKYEAEQRNLQQEIDECEQVIAKADQANVDLKMLMRGLEEFTEIKKLTPEIVNTLIQRIEVHNSDRSSGHITVQVDIYFTAIGQFDLPSQEELLKLSAKMHEEAKRNKHTA